MLLGQYQTKLTSKNRTAIPAALRKELGEKIIISRWYEKSLAIWSIESWKKILIRILDDSLLTRPARDTERFLLGGAHEMELDKQGRVVLAEPLRVYAQLQSEIVFVGLKDRVEVWSKENWTSQEELIVKDAERLIEELQRGRGEKT